MGNLRCARARAPPQILFFKHLIKDETSAGRGTKEKEKTKESTRLQELGRLWSWRVKNY